MKILYRHYQRMTLGLLAVALSSTAGLALTQTTADTDFAMLPALDNSSPASAVLLDVTDTGERLVAVGERGMVTWSDDRGDSWHQATVPISLTLTSVDFAGPKNGWASGHEGLILATTDGGLNWAIQQTGRDTLEQAIPQLEAEAARLQSLLDSTEDPGESAEQDDIAYELENIQYAIEDAQAAIESGPSEPLLDIWFKNDKEGFAVGSYGAFLATTDGGEHWQNKSLSLDNPDKMHLNRFIGSDDGTLYIAGEAGMVFRSSDQGSSWERLDVPYDGSLFGILTPGADQVLVHGLRGNILYSSDKGDSWQTAPSDVAVILVQGAVDDGKVLLVGAAGTVLQSNLDGSNLQQRHHPARATFSAVLPLDGDAILLVGAGGAIKISSFSELEREQL